MCSGDSLRFCWLCPLALFKHVTLAIRGDLSNLEDLCVYPPLGKSGIDA